MEAATVAPASPEYRRLARRARLLSWASLGWMTCEGVVGVVAGAVAGSVALVGFGIDSAIEGLASVIVIWRLTGSRLPSETAERRAQKAIAVSFWLLAPYVAVEAIRTLVAAVHPETSVAGIVLSAGSIALMPCFGVAKHRLGRRLGSAAIAGVAVDVNAMEFIQVARARGEGTPHIVLHEIWPNMILPVLTDFGLRFVFAVLLLSSLGFLGLGIQPPNADWGALVRENMDGVYEAAPAVIVPALAIATLTIAVNLVIDSFSGRRSEGRA